MTKLKQHTTQFTSASNRWKCVKPVKIAASARKLISFFGRDSKECSVVLIECLEKCKPSAKRIVSSIAGATEWGY